MVLVARIKTNKRREVKKRFFFKKSDTFKYNDVEYHIRPNCIYSTYSFFGFWRSDTLDFVEGNGEPVDYYRPIDIPGRKNLDVVSKIIGKILQYANKMIMYIFILVVASIFVGVVNILVGKGVV